MKNFNDLNLESSNGNLVCENLDYLLNQPLNQQSQVLKLNEATAGLVLSEKMEKNAHKSEPIFELKAHDCPKSLLKDFQSYFRMNSIKDTPMTVVTISFKTENDMALWNNQVDAERELLTEKFVETAQDFCHLIEQEGFWADYVDPFSGSLHKSEYTYATFYETDERYRKLGFEIVDHGCCKVISHHTWGTKTYVGCILTNASVTDKILKKILEKKDAN